MLVEPPHAVFRRFKLVATSVAVWRGDVQVQFWQWKTHFQCVELIVVEGSVVKVAEPVYALKAKRQASG